MSRLANLIRDRMAQRKKLLSVFLTAGYPELESLPQLVDIVADSGADFVEIGIPFSDPIADGPVIQKSSQVALANGIDLRRIIEQISEIRKTNDIPIVLMGYLNPMLRYGLRDFVTDAQGCGVDGFIIPDLIPEEYERLQPAFPPSSPGVNFLVSPNTPLARAKAIADLTHDFVYCVSVTGVTGARDGIATETVAFLQSIRQVVSRPYFVGFGISSAQDAARLAGLSDGVIVGSAIIRILDRTEPMAARLGTVGDYVSGLKSALEGLSDGNC